ncbi:MAG TPA: leucine--tRNA ligase [Candidatus Latescibacteria bacterium]|nr:leucine--tRNA ligase [Candidatus Latescibacterota bacterium]HOF59965.1 leucine--tRNA ligase [Candidatus Latescibacterota bacterium]HOS63248.1 leucine--tRNA ligase [Candidatus Latescibacterota bacterium]HPK74569.1 leucine--tRNA ligase [Candidatus Latescibacterota bacterium]
MIPYDFRTLEPQWRAWWEENKINEAKDGSSRPKYYCLDMFPYPSGEGLHVGHWRNYVLSDVWSRYQRLRGYQVLHPMGWDAFGLPAENFAIKHKIHPRISTARNIANMKRQLKIIGAMYDWSREISTCDPEYYRWTQWIFLRMYKRGLAYRSTAPVNWCPSCRVGLANEEVVAGGCERCGTAVVKRDLVQWYLRITAYAERLLRDLERLDWPERVKTMQANWIGRSEGARITFTAVHPGNQTTHPIDVFTTRPDTLFGATYMVLAPEHPLVPALTMAARRKEVEAYREQARNVRDVDRTSATRPKTGVPLGSVAINPANGNRIPIWISDYVLMGYGTGAIMAVPAHDERDFEFARTFNLPVVEVVYHHETVHDANGRIQAAYTGEGTMIQSSGFDGLDSRTGGREIVEMLARQGKAEATVSYRLRDWLFSRQRYWGEPIPIVYCEKCGEQPVPEEQLPVLLPEVESYEPTGTGESPLAGITEWVNTVCPVCGGPAKRETDTMPQWAGSSWYFLRYASPDEKAAAFDREKVNKWLPVDMYVGGVEHAILHLLYARFFTKVLFDEGAISFDEPFTKLFNQGMICRKSEKTGRVEKMSKSKGNIVSPDGLVEKYGTDAVRMYELFVGPPEQDAEWNDNGIEGISRFLHRAWGLITSNLEPSADPERLLRARHRLVKQVTEGLESFKFNTTISRMMEFVNFALDPEGGNGKLDADTRDAFIVLLAPFAPHMAEELWKLAGKQNSVFDTTVWPSFDEGLASAEKMTIAVQVNGKIRATVELDADSSDETARAEALAQPNVQRYLAGKEPRKIIVVPGRLVSIVV